MILPGTTNFIGVIGTTFDALLTVYTLETNLVWSEPVTWNESVTYPIKSAVVAANGSAYKSIKIGNLAKPPESSAEYWEKITPFNLKETSAKMKVGSSITLEGGTGLTLG